MHIPKLRLTPLALLATLPLVAGPALAEIEEIVVTAQKRAENAQDIGIAITAISGDALEELGLTTAVEVATQVPGLDIKNTLGSTNPVITVRGVGLNDFHANNSQSAGVYVDEVYMSAPAMLGFQLFDLDRVEVLKGPQGTLYGRNTTAGAINFISAKPTAEFEAGLTLGVGRYDTYEGEGFLSGPLTETLRGRVAIKYTDRQGGYVTNTFTGNDEYGAFDSVAGRVLLDWEPTDDLLFTLNVHGGSEDGDALTTWKPFGTSIDPPDFVTECDLFVETGFSGPGCVDWTGYADANPDDPYSGAWNWDPQMDVDSHGASLKIEASIADMTFTSITGYEYVERMIEEDGGGSPLEDGDIVYINENSVLSQELRLTSNPELSGRWILGLYYSEEEADGLPNQFILSPYINGTTFSTFWYQDTTSFAAFAHTEWDLTDTLRLTAGVRYTDEEKDYRGYTRDDNPYGFSYYLAFFTPYDPTLPAILAQTDDSISDQNVSGKLALDWTPNDDMLLYASVSRGFKSGGFSGAWAGSDDELAPFDPEYVNAYEIGMKSMLLDSTLQLNAALFHYAYDGMQVFTTPRDPDSLAVIVLTNSEEARITGAEIEAWWAPTDSLDLRAGVSFLDTENKDPEFLGLELPNAPAYSFNYSARYAWELSGNSSVAFLLSGSYQDDVFRQVENRSFHRVEGYGLLNARISFATENWELALWGENLTDEAYVYEVFDQTYIQANYILNYGPPLDYGLSFTYRW